MEYNKTNDIVSEMAQKIEAEKMNILAQKIAEKVKLDEPLDLSKEMQRRFPRIIAERNHDQSTNYYWNDGTEEGIRLVSFYEKPLDMNVLGDSGKFNIGFNYC